MVKEMGESMENMMGDKIEAIKVGSKYSFSFLSSYSLRTVLIYTPKTARFSVVCLTEVRMKHLQSGCSMGFECFLAIARTEVTCTASIQ